MCTHVFICSHGAMHTEQAATWGPVRRTGGRPGHPERGFLETLYSFHLTMGPAAPKGS